MPCFHFHNTLRRKLSLAYFKVFLVFYVMQIIKDSELEGKRVELETFCGIYEQISKAPGQATFEDMVEAFKTYDKESNGFVSGAQIRQLLINMGDTLTEPEAETILLPHEDEKGEICYQDLIKALISTGGKKQIKDTTNYFYKFYRN